jgi:hypothetical protein
MWLCPSIESCDPVDAAVAADGFVAVVAAVTFDDADPVRSEEEWHDQDWTFVPRVHASSFETAFEIASADETGHQPSVQPDGECCGGASAIETVKKTKIDAVDR